MERVSFEEFQAQRKPRFGKSNPERMEIPHWEWMVRTRLNSYMARSEHKADMNECFDRAKEWKPDWCFDRFGISRTHMPDGRIICIGGEHEDWYDPDFCIFNDVVVLRPAPGNHDVDTETGEIEIYGYPETIFPPTDFHSATLVDERIFVIGSLGYMHGRKPDHCPVRTLDTNDYRMDSPKTRGSGPGWISRHHASYDQSMHCITVRGGKRCNGDDYADNHGVHRLQLEGLKWEQLAGHERHFRYLFRCVEQAGLSRIESGTPDTAIEAYQPEIPFVELDVAWKDFATRRLDINGVRIEFEDWFDEIRLLIEGDPGEDVRAEILRGIQQHLTETSGYWWKMTEVDSFGDGS